jgi:hypothetical protein
VIAEANLDPLDPAIVVDASIFQFRKYSLPAIDPAPKLPSSMEKVDFFPRFNAHGN